MSTANEYIHEILRIDINIFPYQRSLRPRKLY